jgi:phage replication-related protein YjqB (UPF0714/DUF867 family)
MRADNFPKENPDEGSSEAEHDRSRAGKDRPTVRHHLLIGGTGRAGTTVLVQLLQACGLDTGSEHLRYSLRSRAGLEGWFDPDHSPYVVKSPHFSENLSRLFEEGLAASSVDAIIVPMRGLDDAANSRIAVFAEHGLRTPGGLWRNRRPSLQRELLAESAYRLVKTASDHHLPLVLLSFPEFINDSDYAWTALAKVLPGVDRATFLRRHAECVRPELISVLPPPSRWRLAYLDASWALQTVRRKLAVQKYRLRG